MRKFIENLSRKNLTENLFGMSNRSVMVIWAVLLLPFCMAVTAMLIKFNGTAGTGEAGVAVSAIERYLHSIQDQPDDRKIRVANPLSSDALDRVGYACVNLSDEVICEELKDAWYSALKVESSYSDEERRKVKDKLAAIRSKLENLRRSEW